MQRLVMISVAVLSLLLPLSLAANDYFQIRVVDKETGRGIPMVEFRTLHEVRYLTDSNGLIAFREAGLMNEKVFFHIIGQGYQYPADFLGYRGMALQVTPGDSTTIELTRTTVAERIYRVTGAGIYHDSQLLGHSSPLKQPNISGRVLGQDSNLSLIFGDKIFWLWGDTFRPDYPLGNFSISAATSPLPKNGGLNPDLGVDYQYFVDESGFSKKMIELPDKGFVWFDWLLTLNDKNGREQLVAKYARVKLDFTNHERGIAVFDEEQEMFLPHKKVDEWIPDYHSTVHPVLVNVDKKSMYYFTSEFFFQRAAPELEALSTPAQYQSFTCLKPGADFDLKNPQIERDAAGEPVWGWKTNTAAIDVKRQKTLVDSGWIKPAEKWLHLVDFATGNTIEVNRGSLYWNEYRQKWVLVAGANIGEVWYAEGDTPLGPWVYLRKVADHQQLLYNPVQHPFFDKENGRIIYFEGTYANTFLQDQPPAPRYQYNQLMYRLQLDDQRLFMPETVYETTAKVGGKARQFYSPDMPGGNSTRAAFLAFAPDRVLPGLIPVYANNANGALTTQKPGAASPLLYALPAVANPFENYIGKWRCSLTDKVFFSRDFDLRMAVEEGVLTADLQDAGLKLLGFEATADSVNMTIQYFDELYEVVAFFTQGKISGKWTSNIPGKQGVLEGQLNDPLRYHYHLPSLQPLYLYVSEDGAEKVYSTPGRMKKSGYQQRGPALCRVWEFPGSLLILDRNVRHKNK